MLAVVAPWRRNWEISLASLALGIGKFKIGIGGVPDHGVLFFHAEPLGCMEIWYADFKAGVPSAHMRALPSNSRKGLLAP